MAPVVSKGIRKTLDAAIAKLTPTHTTMAVTQLKKEVRINLSHIKVSTENKASADTALNDNTVPEVTRIRRRRKKTADQNKAKIKRSSLVAEVLVGRVIKRRKRRNTKNKAQLSIRQSVRLIVTKRQTLFLLKPLKCPRTVEVTKNPMLVRSDANKVLFASCLGLLPGKSFKLLKHSNDESDSAASKEHQDATNYSKRLELHSDIRKRIIIIQGAIKTVHPGLKVCNNDDIPSFVEEVNEAPNPKLEEAPTKRRKCKEKEPVIKRVSSRLLALEKAIIVNTVTPTSVNRNGADTEECPRKCKPRGRPVSTKSQDKATKKPLLKKTVTKNLKKKVASIESIAQTIDEVARGSCVTAPMNEPSMTILLNLPKNAYFEEDSFLSSNESSSEKQTSPDLAESFDSGLEIDSCIGGEIIWGR